VDQTGVPTSQVALQLVGPGKLKLNDRKEVLRPGPTQVLAKVEAVGVCFSDLKLLKQFSQHPRKSVVTSGLEKEVLSGIPSYVPDERPTVPGHEVALRIVAVGERVTRYKAGERCMVQTDFRELPTQNSNAAFGYNFEGALQEYVLMDERVMIEPSTRERYLIPVSERLSASAVAMVEPWACVENSYANPERRTLKAGGKLLVVAEAGHEVAGLKELLSGPDRPASIVAVGAAGLPLPATTASDPASLPNESFDDIVYFGARKATLDVLNDKLAVRGLINIVTGGRKIGAPISVGIGRVHYALTRWTGTVGSSAQESYRNVPSSGELRPGDRVAIIGAAGPMGQMHIIRAVCSGVPRLAVVGTDVDDARLEVLGRKALRLARERGVDLRLVNTQKEPTRGEKFSYIALMVPVGALVADSIRDSRDGALINIFAGIPASTRHDLDLDAYIERRCFMFGTSGSVIRDMKAVLAKVESGQLDTNLSIDAVCGMAGAADGLAAVENRKLMGKVVIYPPLRDLGLVPLSDLAQRFPTVASRLSDGAWTPAAEEELRKVAATQR